MSQAIALENVSVCLGGEEVLSRFSLSLSEGEVIALLGPSGAGKTTVLRVLLGFVVPYEGSVLVRGERVTQGSRILRPPEERGLAVVFQDLALWPHLTVHGNLAFVLESGGLRRAERERRIAEMLDRVSLTAKARRYPAELSGGERQRVALARALVADTSAVLFDEPLANLDVDLKLELLALIRELLEERGATAIYVTHDLREAVALGERIVVIEQGRAVQAGTFQELRARPATPFIRTLVEEVEWTGTTWNPAES